MTGLVHLGDEATSFVVDLTGGAVTIVHWGAALRAIDEGGLHESVAAMRPIGAAGALDAIGPLTLVPEHGSGFPGRPGLSGRRADGSCWSPRFTTAETTADDRSVGVTGLDVLAGLRLDTEIELRPTGVARLRARVTNVGATHYWLDDLAVSLPLPGHAVELLTFHGRWCREFHERRIAFTAGAFVAENRRGRTSHEHPPLIFAGTTAFGEQHGEVWGAHLAWSGNARVAAERLPDGRRHLQLGELLHPGEVVLAAGASYETPWVFAVHDGAGLTPATRGFHRHVRELAAHPTRPRPVVMNTWEAVYFDHDRASLFRLAERAARVGAERFVLDDGWFGGRRHDRAGLGDWWVSPDAHPDGLTPLVEHVRRLGMEFGIWVEPEMVSPDSDLYRAHPEWALATAGYEPVLGRSQLVLDLANPDAYAQVLRRLDDLLGGHDIAFVKWDMNRDHVQGSGADGRAGTRAQTLAVYALLDELRRRHPDVEFESCASGGGRIDLAILERTQRVWTSDCNDALERQQIQHGVSMLVPPEVMGAHVGAARSHTTGRTQSLRFRAATALFGHFGIEWDLLGLDDDELDELAGWVALHRRHRQLLHHGDVVRIDHPSDEALVHGVLAADRREALVAYVQLTTAQALAPLAVRIPELLVDVRYRVAVVDPARPPRGDVPILDGLVLTGGQLAAHGVLLPVVAPESVLLLHLTADTTEPVSDAT